MLKQTKALFILWLIVAWTSVQAGNVIVPKPAPPKVAAKSHILLDFESGKMIAANNPDEVLPPASITKLMTSYVVMQELKAGNITLDDEVLISEKAWRMIGSRSFLKVNTKVPVQALLRGMIIQSGNDAAVALAEHIAGSEEVFAQMMTQYAIQLGMTSTNYMNSTGLPDPNHYTTARDIATLSAALIRDFPEEYKWYSEKEYTYNDITQHNRNKLLWRDSSVDGLKTGHTEEAGYCLAASAKRGSMRLISVVLGTRSENVRAQETQKLLNYGFRFFETHHLYKTNAIITDTKIWKGERDNLQLGVTQDLVITVPRGQYDQLNAVTNVTQPVVAPITAGTVLGEVEITLGDELIAKEQLVALSDVPKGSWWRQLVDTIMLLIFG